MKRGFILAILTAVALLLTACGGASSGTAPGTQPQRDAETARAAAPPDLNTQTSDAGNVVVDVTPISLSGDRWDFQVGFNTHSVNLAFDPAQVSVLRCDQGQEFQALAWDGSGAGGHHRSGVLSFARPDHPVSSVELVVRGVAEVPERVFHWAVPANTASAGEAPVSQASAGASPAGSESAPQAVTAGQSGPPHVTLSADVFAYGDVPIDGEVVTRQIQITNTGSSTLHIGEIEPT